MLFKCVTVCRAKSATAEDLRKTAEPSKFAIQSTNPVHASIQHIQTYKSQTRHPPSNPGLSLMGQSGEHAFYVKTVPGTFGQVVLKNAARTNAATKVQATASLPAQAVPKTTNLLLLARYGHGFGIIYVPAATCQLCDLLAVCTQKSRENWLCLKYRQAAPLLTRF